MENWSQKGEWSEITIHESKTGWVIETDSQVQGTITGRKVLVYYSDHFPQGLDLDAAWNDSMSNGGALILRIPNKVLRRGQRVV